MWIDAFCINQGNMRERSQQVTRMSDIYSRASRVIIWLGPESEDSVLAMDTLVDLGNKVGRDVERTKFQSRTGELLDWTEWRTLLPYTQAQIEAICRLYDRPWFERLWIWQEARLANDSALGK
jgi:Heterokaryon incompatibility protein (HET)